MKLNWKELADALNQLLRTVTRFTYMRSETGFRSAAAAVSPIKTERHGPLTTFSATGTGS